VVWDATNLRKDFRSILHDLGKDYHAFTTLLVFHQKVGEILSGNKKRNASVASDIIKEQINHMEWVALDEAHKVVFVNRTAILQEC
jgi:predicted kinase